MKIAIVGTGAMGSVYAGLMADAGYQVWAIDLWQDHVDAINRTGLRVEGYSGDRTVSSLKASADLADAGDCDLYIIATKADGVEKAAKAISAVMKPSALVLTIQNGLGSAERIRQHMPPENVLIGVAEGFGASMRGPGHVHHNNMQLVRLGEMAGGITDRVQKVEAVWRNSGFKVKSFDDIDQLIWEKFVCNVTLSAPCTAFMCTVGELMSDPARWEVAQGCCREAYAMGIAKGVAFSFDDPVAYVTRYASGLQEARPSMLLDHFAERRSEIDAINGMVPILGRELGIPSPYNDTLCAVLRAKEDGFES